MKVLAQRVKGAKLFVDEEDVGKIAQGLLVFVGIENDDILEDVSFMVDKLVNLRIFEDDQAKLNLSPKDKGLEIMCIPNFTLAGSVHKGRRPSFDNAAGKEKGKEFFDLFCRQIEKEGLHCVSGIFGASMTIDVRNYGPVNIILDSCARHNRG